MNRRAFFKTLAGLAAATWAETMTGPVTKFRQPGISFPEGSISYRKFIAAHDACVEGYKEPDWLVFNGCPLEYHLNSGETVTLFHG